MKFEIKATSERGSSVDANDVTSSSVCHLK